MEFPFEWRNQAQRLLRSANILAQAHERAFTDYGTIPNPNSDGRILEDEWKLVDYGIHVVAGLLFAYSIEVMTKGLLVAQKKIQGPQFPKWAKTHVLSDLFTEASFQIYPSEEEVVAFLIDCAYWQGRYPIPLKGPFSRRSRQEGFALSGSHFQQLVSVAKTRPGAVVQAGDR